MAILEILKYPDQRLKLIAEPVTDFGTELKNFVQDMIATMYHDGGVGLAATQVNVQKRVIVMDTSPEQSKPLVFINPNYKPLSDLRSDIAEGCLSLPGVSEKLNRYEEIVVDAYDENGFPFTLELSGLSSVCIQHELDHLNGILLLDHLSKLKLNFVTKKLLKQRKKEQS